MVEGELLKGKGVRVGRLAIGKRPTNGRHSVLGEQLGCSPPRFWTDAFLCGSEVVLKLPIANYSLMMTKWSLFNFCLHL